MTDYSACPKCGRELAHPYEPCAACECAGCGHCADYDDCGCQPVCDEGRACEKHGAEEAAKWAAYFGLRPDMTREQRRAQLDAFRPYDAAEQAEALKLK